MKGVLSSFLWLLFLLFGLWLYPFEELLAVEQVHLQVFAYGPRGHFVVVNFYLEAFVGFYRVKEVLQVYLVPHLVVGNVVAYPIKKNSKQPCRLHHHQTQKRINRPTKIPEPIIRHNMIKPLKNIPNIPTFPDLFHPIDLHQKITH